LGGKIRHIFLDEPGERSLVIAKIRAMEFAGVENSMVMRLYWPREKPPSLLDGSWKLPEVKKVQ
jgi:hypothetical protein